MGHAAEGNNPDTPGRRRRPRVSVLLVALVGAALAGLLAFGLVSRGVDRTIDDALAHRQAPTAPDFRLAVLDRGRLGHRLARVTGLLDRPTLALHALRGVPVVLNFWASWCQPCREEAPVLRDGWKSAKREGVLFLGVDVQDAPRDARAMLRRLRIDYPSVRDPGRDSGRPYGVTGYPETFFIARDGRVVGHAIGELTPHSLAVGVRAARTGRLVSPLGRGAQGKPR